ncbi:PREDICTED: 5'-nucleotidase domain-containing protein 1-like [Priapulus caudatus]|uniref:5'-nucleotidase domain-containing protein 1-like n=1 Tax=Priapulus caudatus TaxID=37621 RepID=A0ABM1ELZ6_PRICU|nr:PREDICTED: 5'-nucleotidase domain-containing protein 1-like [Priapulus caudatus]
MYFPDNFSEMKGSYFPSMVNRTEDYTFEASQRLRQWLQEMRAAGKITFLLTSSHIDYGSMLLKRILGKDWKLYFDVSFFRARKPLFFTDEDTAFHSITDELKEGPSVDSLKMHGCYLNGNWNLFRSFLKHESGMADPKVLYFGDSLPSDIVASRQFSDWTTVAIVEELETEELDTIERHISQEDRNLLSSKQWGSFFYDNCPISGQVTNTFWHQVLRDNTPLVIPHMDTLTALPLDRAYNSCIFFPKPAFKDLP